MFTNLFRAIFWQLCVLIQTILLRRQFCSHKLRLALDRTTQITHLRSCKICRSVEDVDGVCSIYADKI